MLGGKNKHSSLGYTIVEVLIVLAVSGVMFIIAANFINGKQQKTAFNQGVNEMASRIQDAIEQVTDGQYSDIPITCSAGSPGSPVSVSADPTKSQGTNTACVFIGKLFQFNSATKYKVLSLVAERSSTSLGPDVNKVGALTVQQTTPQQLKVSSVTVNGAAAPGKSFGFAQSQGSADAAGNYTNGAQTVSLVYATTASVAGNVKTADSASICLNDGQYYAQINIGGTDTGGNPLGIHIKMLGSGGVTC